MRIPKDHYLLHRYLEIFGLNKQLFPFEMRNKIIHLSGMPEGKRTMTYDAFDKALVDKDGDLLNLFPKLKDEEKSMTCDQLFDTAVQKVKQLWLDTYTANGGTPGEKPPYNVKALVAAFDSIGDMYDKYTLRSYLTDVAGWSEDAVNLYDLGNAHVVFENGFIESSRTLFCPATRAARNLTCNSFNLAWMLCRRRLPRSVRTVQTTRS
jgi:monoamine oxidase